jgi:predicted nucleic acid-binding protein
MRAVLDACVLYPTVLRDILIGAADQGLFMPLWSDRLIQEWARTAHRRGGAHDADIARGQMALIKARFGTACIPPDPALEAQLWLPDPGDIHVLATAITARADAIITLNLKDFPKRDLYDHDLVALHPDAAIMQFWDIAPEKIRPIIAAAHHRAKASTGQDLALRALLKRARLPRLARAVTQN